MNVSTQEFILNSYDIGMYLTDAIEKWLSNYIDQDFKKNFSSPLCMQPPKHKSKQLPNQHPTTVSNLS